MIREYLTREYYSPLMNRKGYKIYLSKKKKKNNNLEPLLPTFYNLTFHRSLKIKI